MDNYYYICNDSFCYTFWVCLTLLSHQINKSRIATFGISIITSLIPIIVLGILIGMVVFASSR